MKPVLVQMAGRAWTTQAVHLASALARSSSTDVILLRLMHVQHTSYLGTALGNEPLTAEEHEDIYSYAETAEDYGVSLSVTSKQCTGRLSALVEAADQLDAEAVFAFIPPSRIPYWQRFQTWLVRFQLFNQQRRLFTLTEGDQAVNRVPTIVTTEPLHAPIAK